MLQDTRILNFFIIKEKTELKLELCDIYFDLCELCDFYIMASE